jgi:S-DNA-T family DNA segregation ATPase FtsK/SpoIIIE
MAKPQARRSGRAPQSRGQRKQPGFRLTRAQWGWTVGLILLGVALVTFLTLISTNHGSLTALWLDTLGRTFGWGRYLVPLVLGAIGLWAITLGTEHPLTLPWPRVVGGLVTLVLMLALIHHFLDQPESAAAAGKGGGYLGYGISALLTDALGSAGAVVILITVIALALTVALDVSLAELAADTVEALRRFRDWFRHWRVALQARMAERRRESPSIAATPALRPSPPPRTMPDERQPFGSQPAPSPDGIPAMYPSTGGGPVRPWSLPRIADLLAPTEEAQMSLSDIRAKTHIIEETLRSLGVPVTVVEVNPGPVVTQFGLEPGYTERRERDGRIKRVKVKVSRIASLSNDLALALAAAPIRIETPVPGKGIVGLEVPNAQRTVVGLRGVLESEQFQELRSPLGVGLGRDVSGEAVADDLATLPHLLIAGATGSGKSVCINTLIACLLMHNTPDDLKMLMIDPKRVELSAYNGIPHLIAPVVVETDRVVGVLNWVAREMDRRYKVFAKVGARHVQSYNELAISRGETRLPYIVVFIDELADLMMVAPDEVERSICRIAQMARATGIHLVIATQRPSVDVVTGLIKANFPARVAFAVTSLIDSRVILDTPGAEKLLGRGDALYMAPDSPKLERVQACWVADAELERLIDFWKDQVAGRPVSDPHMEDMPVSGVQKPLWADMNAPQVDEHDEDPLLQEAIEIVLAEQRASVSYLQRKLRIGYTRAARLIDLLESRGIIGPATGNSKARDVLDAPNGATEHGRDDEPEFD